MKYLFLCEGNNEKTLVDLLLDYNKLKINRNDLLGLTPYNAKQLTNPTILSTIKMYNNPIIVCRIGDTQREKLIIPEEIKDIIYKVEKYCTLPELEILLIINEGLYSKFLNSKEKKPKTFAKKNISYNKVRYDQSSDFLKKYYGENRINLLIKNINEYKRLKKKHKKDELYLADLLK